MVLFTDNLDCQLRKGSTKKMRNGALFKLVGGVSEEVKNTENQYRIDALG